jgi:CBS domain-containing protein
MNVSEAMETDVKACGSDTNLEAAAMMMWNHDCGFLPVVDSLGKPLGVITDRDIAMSAALNHKPLWELTAGDIISGQTVHLCEMDVAVRSALKTIWAQKVRRVPVVDGGGQLRGVLSVDDIVTLAERGSRGQPLPPLSYDDAVMTLKAVARHH